MKILINHKADLEARDNGDMTALMWSSFNGKLDVVQELIRAGAQVNAITRDQNTALSLARSRKHQEVIDALREAGAY